MTKLDLTEEEKLEIIEAINHDAEPPAALMHKLFPHLAEKFDVAALDRAKIATLEYSGKRSEAAILNQAFLVEGGSPLQIERCFDKGRLTGETQLTLFNQSQKADMDWRNLMVQGDNLQFLKTCYQNTDPLVKDKVKGKVKLAYIDPPFATKSDFKGAGDEKSYSDKVASAEFIEGLRERLIYLREILAEDGSIYVHLDQKMNNYLKIILDEIFGKEQFKNEIVWRRTPFAGSSKARSRKFPVNHDTIFFYAKGKHYTFNQQYSDYSDEYKQRFKYKDDTGYYRKTLLKTYSKETEIRLKKEGRFIPPQKDGAYPSYKQYLHESKGKQIEDIWDDLNLANPMAKERIDYPTQKPEILLERIIDASSNPGDLIMDVFGGSGTTAAVAEKLGRRWITCDFGKHAIYTMQKRILRIAESKALGPDAGKNQKHGQAPKPFCVVSCGAYDFSRIMNLRENKDAYVDFVLGLFQLPRQARGFNEKYRLANIYGEKDGNPVEVYPVWDDEYLKNIRIDEDYLNAIITQAGGRLRGDYYIITPETCTVTGDLTLKNQAGSEVHFKLLKFPYKILEDVSRNFQIQEQPSSQENVNNLITTTGFYFNDPVEIEIKKIKGGLKITRFSSGILDKNGEKYQGIEALAMLLVDVDYDDRIFDMEITVFAKDISDKNEVRISGLTNSVAVIAIDRHGNESRPFILKD
jgi:DNA modification methylase